MCVCVCVYVNVPACAHFMRTRVSAGKNVYDYVGGMSHESAIYNIAMGRLDAYTYDLFNMNECLW